MPGVLMLRRLLASYLTNAPEEDSQTHQKYPNPNRSRPIQCQPNAVHVFLLFLCEPKTNPPGTRSLGYILQLPKVDFKWELARVATGCR